jgi:hypothetical protein
MVRCQWVDAPGLILEWAQRTIDETITCGFRSDQATTPASTLSGENTFPSVPLRTICPEQPSNLTTGHTDISRGDIRISANVLVQLPHKSHAKLANLVISLALGVEIGTTFPATHRH